MFIMDRQSLKMYNFFSIGWIEKVLVSLESREVITVRKWFKVVLCFSLENLMLPLL